MMNMTATAANHLKFGSTAAATTSAEILATTLPVTESDHLGNLG